VTVASLFFRPRACCLTLRSSGRAPAWHLAREALAVIIRLAGQAPHRRAPLSSNVRRHMPSPHRLAHFGAVLSIAAVLAGCASTSVTVQPSPQAPVCNATSPALVLWAPHWRPDQKDVAAREEAASTGLNNFLAQSGCFASTDLRRVPSLEASAVSAQLKRAEASRFKVVGIEVRELGPLVKLLSSAALVEGGTEVFLRVTEHSPDSGAALRVFTVHWKNGGAGVVKGVASLPADMQAALSAAL